MIDCRLPSDPPSPSRFLPHLVLIQFFLRIIIYLPYPHNHLCYLHFPHFPPPFSFTYSFFFFYLFLFRCKFTFFPVLLLHLPSSHKSIYPFPSTLLLSSLSYYTISFPIPNFGSLRCKGGFISIPLATPSPCIHRESYWYCCWSVYYCREPFLLLLLAGPSLVMYSLWFSLPEFTFPALIHTCPLNFLLLFVS